MRDMREESSRLFARRRCFDFFQLVAESAFPGYSSVIVIGENISIEKKDVPEDIWDYGGMYTFSNSADIDRMSSSSAEDTQNVELVGLDTDWNEVRQIVTLSGQDPVALATPLIRVNQMGNIGATDFAGDVYCFVNGDVTEGVPDTDENVRAMARVGNNQALSGIYTIPRGVTGYLLDGYTSLSRAGGAAESADVTVRFRPYGSVFRTKSRVSCVSTGSNSFNRGYRTVPIPISERTDLILRCENITATCGVYGGFSILLKNN